MNELISQMSFIAPAIQLISQNVGQQESINQEPLKQFARQYQNQPVKYQRD